MTAGTLLVVTVASFESELPSLALNLKLSAPTELALYRTDAYGVPWLTTSAVPFVGCSVIVIVSVVALFVEA